MKTITVGTATCGVSAGADKVLDEIQHIVNERGLKDVKIAETGCMPSFEDFTSEKYGHLVEKYLKAEAPAESRARAARLIEWATIGAGVPGCMHGGGSPDGARLLINATADIEKKVELAKRLAGIKEEIAEPERKK